MASAFLIAVLILVVFMLIIIIVIFIRSRRNLIATTSTLSKVPCSAPPPTPINLTASTSPGGVIVLTWSYVITALSYTAYIAESPNFAVTAALQSRITTNNSIGFGNLQLGVQYYFKVKATNSCGDSALSAEISFVLPFTFPRRFVIQSRSNPDLQLCDFHDNPITPLDRVAASRFCTSATSLAFYQSRDDTIRQIDRPDHCLTRTTNPNSIYYNLCVAGDPDQTWQYNSLTTNLCGVGTDGVIDNDCINLLPNFNPEGGLLNHGPPVNSILSDWLITPS